jgi:signal transduction histidine kinase
MTGLTNWLGLRREPRSGMSNPSRGLVLTGVFLVLAMIAGAASLVVDRRAADLAAAEHENESLSAALAEQTRLSFGAVDLVLHDLQERIRAAAVDSPEALVTRMGTQDVQHMLRDEVAALGQIDVASIVATDGRLINFSRRWPVPETLLGDRDYFRALRDNLALEHFIGVPVKSRGTGLTTIYLARRIEAPDGRFLGIVLGAIRLRYFDDLYRTVSSGEGRIVGLQRDDGALLARYPEIDHAVGIIPVADPTVADIQRGARISRSLTPSPVDGRVVLRIARALEDFPLVLVVGRTQDSILEAWQRQTLAIAGGTALAAITLIVAITLLARQISRRAASEAALAATLDHMSQGIMMMDGDSRIQVHNRRVAEMLDIPPELLATKPPFEDILRLQWERAEFGPDGANLGGTARQLILAGGISDGHHSYERRRPDGTVIEVTSIPLAGGGMVRTYTDVTAARTREDALQAALSGRDEAEKALRQRGADLELELAERTRPLAASEARHRDMAEVSSDWIWELDVNLCFTFLSKRFGDTSGIPWAEVSFHPLSVLVALGFDAGGMRDLRAAIDARDSFHNVIHRVDLPDGGTRFWMMSGRPFTDATTGAYAGYRGTGTDVTVRIEREAALNAALVRAEAAERAARRASRRLVDAIEAIPEGFVLHDAEDRLVLCNQRYGEIYGLPPELMTEGVPFEDVLRAAAESKTFVLEGQDSEDWVAERLALHRSVNSIHVEQRLSNGRWMQVDERRTSDGGTVGIRVDVTEARQREAAERDREKLAALGQLAGGVAHEINNLLQPVLALPDLVGDRLLPGDTESREDLACVTESARKMRDIVRNILLFARKEEPRLALLDLVAEVQAALGFVGELMPPSITVREEHLDVHRGCMVAVNKTQLTQVLTNLLVNAAQATAGAGTITVSVGRIDPTQDEAAELAIEGGRDYMTVSIADTGSGMPEAVRARVFEPFFTTKPVGQGTGLGLSVAYGILRSWQGAITVGSAPGQGSTFVLYVPILVPASA